MHQPLPVTQPQAGAKGHPVAGWVRESPQAVHSDQRYGPIERTALWSVRVPRAVDSDQRYGPLERIALWSVRADRSMVHVNPTGC